MLTADLRPPRYELGDPGPWGVVGSVGDVLARGRKGYLIAQAVAVSGVPYSRDAFLTAYQQHKPGFDAVAEQLDFSKIARLAAPSKATVTPYVVGAAFGALVAYALLQD